AFSDALAVHISQESENQHTTKEIWESTLFTFLFKFIFASIFIVPIILFELSLAVIISIILGLSLICIFSLNIAKQQNKNYLKVVIEHLTIAVIVIIATYYIGYYIKNIFI
ncbi:MAG: VIT1/CCC1 transporter family protein, partial [Candidatus Aenigmarchaeota archaeon]|nr:VIT1/CCC1 transporter family protein [Candidatus Aenigmarchaeota archaeon]